MKNSYPKILYPYELVNINESVPTPLKVPEFPELPTKEKFKKPDEVQEASTGCFVNSIIAILISGIGLLILNAGYSFGIVFVLPGGIVFMYYIFGGQSLKEKNERKRSQYLRDLADFEKKTLKEESEYKLKLANYNTKKINYENDCKDIETKNLERQLPKYIESFRHKKLISYFKESKKPQLLAEINDKGITHSFFKHYLLQKFPGQIFDNYYFKDSAFENLYYIPDYVFYDKNLNLFIDIEIDEPYIGNDGTPIHFLRGNDNQRDNFFTRNRWIVLRFAEIQIIKKPTECCNLISEVISSLQNFTILDFSLKSEIEFVEILTKEESHKLAFKNYRKTYLPAELHENISKERLENDRSNLNPIQYFPDELPF